MYMLIQNLNFDRNFFKKIFKLTCVDIYIVWILTLQTLFTFSKQDGKSLSNSEEYHVKWISKYKFGVSLKEFYLKKYIEKELNKFCSLRQWDKFSVLINVCWAKFCIGKKRSTYPFPPIISFFLKYRFKRKLQTVR